ncbi:MAG: hypothetical protein WCS33_05480 [Candidatus Caldatribacteriota bacterium]
MGIKGLIKIKQERDGKVIDEREIKNVITNAGLAEVANLCGNVSSPAYFTYLALGIGTTAAAATDTALESEIVDTGLDRSSAIVTRETTNVSNDTLQLVKQWTATGVKAVTECGAFNDASAGEMLGHQVFSAINTESNDTIKITYQFIFS